MKNLDAIPATSVFPGAWALQRLRYPRLHVSIFEQSYDGVHWAMVMKTVQLPDGRTMMYTRR